MTFKSALTASAFVIAAVATSFATGSSAQAMDGCGSRYRFSARHQQCVLRTDVIGNRRLQRLADRQCGYNYRYSATRNSCVFRGDSARVIQPYTHVVNPYIPIRTQVVAPQPAISINFGSGINLTF